MAKAEKRDSAPVESVKDLRTAIEWMKKTATLSRPTKRSILT